jgi:hypothetical protein
MLWSARLAPQVPWINAVQHAIQKKVDELVAQLY